MSTSERLVDARLLKQVTLVGAVVPAVLLAWDAWHGQLGVNAVNFVIRTTGLVGLVLITLSLVVTPVRELTGWGRVVAMRRGLGLAGFGYLAVHFAVFVLFDRQASVASTVHEIATRRYLWFGTAALLLMVPLAATSTDAMVTRIGPVGWKRLHRLAYPIAIGAVVHYYLLVKSDVTQPVAFAAVIGALLLYRVISHYLRLRAAAGDAGERMTTVGRGVPTSGTTSGATAGHRSGRWTGELVISRIVDETPDVKTFRLAAIDGGPLPFTYAAGQYLNLALSIGGRRVNRSYTIASSPTRGSHCEISVKRAEQGHASCHLHAEWREGMRVKVSAPAGRFVFAPESASRLVMIAGGIGITPMMATIRSLTDQAWRGEIYLLYAVKRGADIAFRDELTWLASRFASLVRILLTREEAWGRDRASGLVAHGRITSETIASFVPDVTHGPVLLCGPSPMMAALRQTLVAMGVPDAEIRQEVFVSRPAVTDPGAAFAVVSDDADVPLPEADAAIVFRRTGRAVTAAAGRTVLEAAEDAGVAIPYECRSGICGQCKTTLLAGRVAMEVQDALSAADRARGLILACQARALQAVEVDA